MGSLGKRLAGHSQQPGRLRLRATGNLRLENAGGVIERLNAAKEILEDYGNYDWLTGEGGIAIANGGLEWAATYFIMLLVLFFIGAGKYASLDHWIARRLRRTD